MLQDTDLFAGFSIPNPSRLIGGTAENVFAILQDKHTEIVQATVEILEAAGYNVETKVLNTIDYGFYNVNSVVEN